MTLISERQFDFASYPSGKELSDSVYRDGIVPIKKAFAPSWAADLRKDVSREFMDALNTERGTATRGWNRFYFEPYVEKVPAFMDLISHTAVQSVAREMLGDDWRIVEFGSDIPLPGAINQPWHRDFPMPDATRYERRLTSIAVNATTVDVTDGAFQAVLGTHFDNDLGWEGNMFPDDEQEAELNARMQSFYAKAGNISVRSGLMLHRGSAMDISSAMRPVAIVGIVSPEDPAIINERDKTKHVPYIKMSQEYYDHLPDEFKHRISSEIVSETTADLPPYMTDHSFEGLKMDRRDRGSK